jgi:hypothetical protein
VNSYLEALKMTAEYQALLKGVKQQRPIVPVYNPESDNTDAWKANSMMQKGFDLCLMFMGDNPNE